LNRGARQAAPGEPFPQAGKGVPEESQASPWFVFFAHCGYRTTAHQHSSLFADGLLARHA
jgi:hypothetical protein